jgi:hypothetical protein
MIVMAYTKEHFDYLKTSGEQRSLEKIQREIFPYICSLLDAKFMISFVELRMPSLSQEYFPAQKYRSNVSQRVELVSNLEHQ